MMQKDPTESHTLFELTLALLPILDCLILAFLEMMAQVMMEAKTATPLHSRSRFPMPIDLKPLCVCCIKETDENYSTRNEKSITLGNDTVSQCSKED
jgi:hypothetical protein